MLFDHEQLQHQLTKRVRNLNFSDVSDVVAAADRLLSAISREQFSFERAKEAVMRSTSLQD